jgi:hypothetical protein
MTLLEIVRDLEPRLQEGLSAIEISLWKGRAVARLSFALYTRSTRVGDTELYRIQVDTELPAGVSLTGFERWPDLEKEITLTRDIRSQLKALQESRLVGGLDVAMFEPPPGATAEGLPRYRWIVKTHASSQEERDAWLRGLHRQRG